MVRRSLILSLAPFALLIALPASAQERACECSDLPHLEDQLFQQEYLQYLSREFDATDPMNAFNPPSNPGSYQDRMTNCFNLYVQYGSTDCSRPDTGHGSAPPPPQEASTDSGAGAATDVFHASCGLLDEKGNPTTASKFHNRPNQPKNTCKADNDFLMAHEAQHRKVCKANWAAGHGSLYQNMSYYAADDAKAYGAGVKVLRASIADLAKQCGWEGSANDTKPDKNRKNGDKPNDQVKTVPTPDQAKQLASALKAGRGK